MMSTLLKFQATGLSQMYNGQRHTYGHNIMELCNVLVLDQFAISKTELDKILKQTLIVLLVAKRLYDVESWEVTNY